MKKLTGIVFHDEFRTMDQASPRITLWQDGSIDKKAKPALLLIAEDGEQLPEVPEWIKCSDRLPEDEVNVLVKQQWNDDAFVARRSSETRGGHTRTIWWAPMPDIASIDGDASYDGEVDEAYAKITHWQPLPKAPHQ